MASPGRIRKSLDSLLGNRKKRTVSADEGDTLSEENIKRRVDGPRSKSLGDALGAVQEPDSSDEEEEGLTEGDWHEISLIKSTSPVVMCVLPSIAKDFVASALLAIGAYPLIPEESEDVACQLATAQVILVDTSSKRDIVEAVIEHYIVSTIPMIVVAWESGTNDARKDLTRKIVSSCNPAVISGRLGDIHAISLDIMSRAEGIINAEDDAEKSKKPNGDKPNGDKLHHPLVVSSSVERSPRFVRKKEGKGLQRQKTAIPQMVLKGQFRHQSIKDVSIQKALDSGRKLAAQLACYVHLCEINVVTCGEFFYEINNIQLGMERLHCTLQCAAAIMAAVVACVHEKEGSNLITCGHALSLYHVAAEEAAAKVSSNEEMISPGSLRVAFIDMLHKLDEATVRSKAQTVFHNTPPAKP